PKRREIEYRHGLPIPHPLPISRQFPSPLERINRRSLLVGSRQLHRSIGGMPRIFLALTALEPPTGSGVGACRDSGRGEERSEQTVETVAGSTAFRGRGQKDLGTRGH